MKFYTYVAKVGNRIYTREIDNKGKCYSGYSNFKPTLYLPAPQEKSNYKTLDNKLVKNKVLLQLEKREKSKLIGESCRENHEFLVKLNLLNK